MKNQKEINKALVGMMVVLLATNVAFIAWYAFVGYQASFHSDSAAKVLLAREIYDTGTFFPRDWNYVNGDLFIVFGHLFIVPLLTFMPAGFTAHAVSGIIFSVLILYGIWLVTEIIELTTWRRIAIVATVASGISGFLAENLYGQVSYGIVVLFSCYLLFIGWKYLSVNGRKKLVWGFLLVGLIVLAYWANPKRAFVSYGLPLLAALMWIALSSEQQSRNKYWNLIGLSLLGVGIGSLLHAITIAGVNNVSGAASARWLPYELIIRNLTLTPKGILAIFGGLPLDNVSLFGEEGLYAGIRFIVAIMLMMMIPVAIKKAVNDLDDGMKLIGCYVGFSLALNLFLQITTSIPDMSDPIQSSRYLVPGMLLGLVVLLIQPIQIKLAPLFGMSVAVVMAIFVSSAYTTYRFSDPSSHLLLAQPGQINLARRQMVDFLSQQGLHYGYASYWNAGVLTVLSNEQSKVRQIVIQGGIPMPMKHLSSSQWYRPASWTGATFLLLSDSEVAYVDWKKMMILGATPIRQHKINGFTIFTFKENIARLIPGWDIRYEEPTVFLPAGALSQTGRLLARAAPGERATLIAEKGESGALHYGPYVDVAPGSYRVIFDVFSGHHPAGTVRLDVAAAPDQKLYGEKVLTESNKPQEIEFMLDSTRTMEFRVWALGNERVILRGITLQRRGH